MGGGRTSRTRFEVRSRMAGGGAQRAGRQRAAQAGRLGAIVAAQLSSLQDIVLIGHPFAPIGMGEHVRSVWRAFERVGVHPGIRDVYGLSERSDPDIEREFASQAT